MKTRYDIYNAIVNAKKMADEVCERDFDISYKKLVAIVKDRHRTVIDRVAMCVVLSSGCIQVDALYGMQFLMPSTSDCIRNYNDIKRRYKHRRKQITVTVVDETLFDGYKEYQMSLF